MSCSTPLQIKIGSDNTFGIQIFSESVSWSFTSSGLSVAPAPGDIYYSGANVFRITSVDGATVRAFSDILIEYQSELAATGTLTRSSGSGDAAITYTARTANVVTKNGEQIAPIDVTGHTLTDIKFKQFTTSETALLTLSDISTWINPVNGYTDITVSAAQTADLEGYSSLYFTYALTGPVYKPQEIWAMIPVQTSIDF